MKLRPFYKCMYPNLSHIISLINIQFNVVVIAYTA
jgi:hypothetical protein